MSSRCTCLEHIQQEHLQLNGELIAIGRELAILVSCPSEPLPTELVERLQRLRSALAAHLQVEESGGCLDEAASRMPSAGPLVRQVEADHRELLPSLDRIIEATASLVAGPASGRAQVAEDFSSFTAKFRDHEVTETRLMEYALGGEASEYDVEGNE